MINANVISNFYEKYLQGAIYCIVLKKNMLINVNEVGIWKILYNFGRVLNKNLQNLEK